MPGLVTYGQTLAEACAVEAQTIGVCFKRLQKDGEPWPEGDVAKPQPASNLL
jgi:hypothetical protein